MPFVKLDTHLLDSTLWIDAHASRVFLTALMMAEPWDSTTPMEQLEVRSLEKTGFVVPPGWYGFIPAAGIGIIRRAMLSDEDGYTALEALASADPESRSPEFEGRRLVRIDGGFVVLNFMKFRDRDYGAADRMRRLRERKKGENVRPNVTAVPPNVTQAETEGREQRAQAEIAFPEEHITNRRSSTARAADRTSPFFASVILGPKEAKSKWSVANYRNFWNRHVSTDKRLASIPLKWTKAISNSIARRGLTPATFLAALKKMEQKAPIHGDADFYNAMNLAVRDE
jgi:hypothetical protein